MNPLDELACDDCGTKLGDVKLARFGEAVAAILREAKSEACEGIGPLDDGEYVLDKILAAARAHGVSMEEGK